MSKAGQIWRYRVFKLSGVDDRYVFLVKFLQENSRGDRFWEITELGPYFMEGFNHLWIPKDECEEYMLIK